MRQSKQTKKPAKGQGLVEYALIIALVAVGSIVALQNLATGVDDALTSSTTAIDAAVSPASNTHATN